MSQQTYQIVASLVLAAVLFFPTRQIIWILSVRRAEGRDGHKDEDRRTKLRRRATVTAILLSFVFSVLFANSVMKGPQ